MIAVKTVSYQYILELYHDNHTYLFINDNTGLPTTYDRYRHHFDKVMQELGLNHKCHDTRHTFATKCEELGFSDTEIKAHMGYSFNNDVTNSVYIHRSSDRIYNIIKKLHYT